MLIRVRLARFSPDGIKVFGLKDFERPKDREDQGIWVPPPPAGYQNGSYNTGFCFVRALEEELIDLRARRRSVKTQDRAITVMSLFDDVEFDPSAGTERDQEDFITEFMDSKLLLAKDTPYMDLRYISKYNPTNGFKFAIDGVYNMPNKGFFICMYSLNPPASFYDDDQNSSGLRVNNFYDWDNCSKRLIRFNEGYVKYGNVDYNPFLHFIIDIKEVILPPVGQAEIYNVAWTVVPVFTKNGYANSNIYQIPLVKVFFLFYKGTRRFYYD